jgi:putative acetyltransferase
MQNFLVRQITLKDNLELETLIKTVMTEFGASGEGFSIHDLEVKNMYQAYSKKRHQYLVITDRHHKILGGAGIGELLGLEQNYCELKKMYFYKELRGHGMASIVMEKLLDFACKNYQYCYIETLSGMDAAQSLYQKFGFKKIKEPLGNTGHFGCDKYYLKPLP